MKRLLIISIILIFIGPIILCAGKRNRPSVGLVLSGGGAKGLAHIGVLKILDSLQIPVDYIAGTSMGGIIGGLYAIGYSGLEIEKISRHSNWQELFSDSPPREFLSYLEKEDDSRFQATLGLEGFTPVQPSGFIQGQRISLKFSSLTLSAEYIKNFDDFFIPFRCVAADLISGKEVILKQGSLSKAMRATMSIPTIFSPVEWGDSLLVDGGVLNNLPVDIIREMGAEFVIAVDVGDYHNDRKELQSMLKVLEQTFNLPLQERILKHQQMSNLLIQPETGNFSSSDFSDEKVQQIIQIGDKTAQDFADALTIAKFQYNLHRRNPSIDVIEFSEPLIHGISITGNTTIPFFEMYNLIGLKPGDFYKSEAFNEKLSELSTSGKFESIDYEIRPIDQNSIRLNIKIREKEKPIIFGIYIKGYKRIPFKLIFNMLGLKALQPLDIDHLHQRIDELYGLGYFETISYEIEPASQNRIKLFIHVKEKPQKILQVGFHYDDYFKLVGSVGIRFSDFLGSGLRMKNLLQFSGLIRFNWSLSYPLRSGALGLFPYIRFKYKDIPVSIFEYTGEKIASYKDRSTSGGVGLKLLFFRLGMLELEYNTEFISVEPNIAFPDPELFPSWDPELRKLEANLKLDTRDNSILPRKGLFVNAIYENSTKALNSEISYNRLAVEFNSYLTLLKYHTLQLSGFYGWASLNIPVYKYFYHGGPKTFIGMDYFQLTGEHFAIARVDYRYEYRRDIFFKIIVNFSKNFRDYPYPHTVLKLIEGYGAGIKFLSLIGPLEIIYSRGNKSVFEPAAFRNIWYIQAGFEL